MLNIDLLKHLSLQIRQEDGRNLVWDIVRKKWIQLLPEEHVRQALLHHLIYKNNYPASLISVEKQIIYGNLKKRYDIVVFDRHHNPWMIIECKSPDIPITESGLHQLLQYHSRISCRYWLLSNGIQHYCAGAPAPGDYNINWLRQLPPYPTT